MRNANRGGTAITLSVTEYSLLEYLMRHANRVLTRAQILDHVWQYDFGGLDNVLDAYTSYLRQKIDKNRELKPIQTVRGVGFKISEVQFTPKNLPDWKAMNRANAAFTWYCLTNKVKYYMQLMLCRKNGH